MSDASALGGGKPGGLPPGRLRRCIYVLSDSTGETAHRVVRAAMLQFDRPEIDVKVFSRVRRADEIESILRRAQADDAMVVYTVVDPEQRARVGRVAGELGIETLEPIGQLMAKLATFLERQPSGKPGVMPGMDAEYFRRIEAVEFAVKQDDGQNPNGLAKADIVLTGISRTSKTPLSTFLAQRGVKVANVPIVLGIPLPKELFEIPQAKIYGLTIDLATLVRIRRARLKQLNMPLDTDYGMREHVIKELKYAREIFRGNPAWPVVDVSLKAIEETASIILWIMKERESRGTRDLSNDQPDEFGGLYPH